MSPVIGETRPCGETLQQTRARRYPFVVGRLVMPDQLNDVGDFLDGMCEEQKIKEYKLRPDAHIAYIPRNQCNQLDLPNEGSFYGFLGQHDVELMSALHHTDFTITGIVKSNCSAGQQQLVLRGRGDDNDYYDGDQLAGERSRLSPDSSANLTRIVLGNIRFGKQAVPGGIVPQLAEMLVDRKIAVEKVDMIPQVY